MNLNLTNFAPEPSSSDDDHHVPCLTIPPSTHPQCPYRFNAGSAVGTPTDNSPGPGPGSPPSTPPSFVAGSAASTTSDTEEDVLSLTPTSKQPGSAYRFLHASARGISPTPDSEYSDAFPVHCRTASFEDQHHFLRLTGRSINDNDSSEPISQMVSDAYFRVTEDLSTNTFRCLLHYLEAVHERKRMNYFTSCWEVAEIKRREALAVCMREESKADFINAERESRYLLDIFAQRLSLPRATDTDGPHTIAACDNAKGSLRRTDAELAILKARAHDFEERMADD